MRALPLSLLAAVALFAAAGCEKKPKTGTDPESGSAEASTQEAPLQGTILIGEVGSLTGPQATFGISTRNGIELAINEANAQGGVKGKKLAIRVYDNQGKAEESANAVTRLITQDKVALILGEVASTNSIAMARKAQPAQVPMISPSSTSMKVTEVGDYIFRVCFVDPFQGFVMAKFAAENLATKKAAILKDQKSDYSLGLSEVFSREYPKMGGKVVGSEAYAQGDTDFRAQLTALKGLQPEVIYVPGYYTDVGLIARQARELGIKAVLLGGDGWESSKLYELGGRAIEGSYFSNHYSPEDPSPAVRKFIEDYKAAYGNVPDSLAALGYDSARVAIEALKRTPDLSGPAIRDAIAATKDFTGVAGTITLDSKRNAIKPAVVLKVEGGASKYVATIAP